MLTYSQINSGLMRFTKQMALDNTKKILEHYELKWKWIAVAFEPGHNNPHYHVGYVLDYEERVDIRTGMTTPWKIGEYQCNVRNFHAEDPLILYLGKCDREPLCLEIDIRQRYLGMASPWVKILEYLREPSNGTLEERIHFCEEFHTCTWWSQYSKVKDYIEHIRAREHRLNKSECCLLFEARRDYPPGYTHEQKAIWHAEHMDHPFFFYKTPRKTGDWNILLRGDTYIGKTTNIKRVLQEGGLKWYLIPKFTKDHRKVNHAHYQDGAFDLGLCDEFNACWQMEPNWLKLWLDGDPMPLDAMYDKNKWKHDNIPSIFITNRSLEKIYAKLKEESPEEYESVARRFVELHIYNWRKHATTTEAFFGEFGAYDIRTVKLVRKEQTQQTDQAETNADLWFESTLSPQDEEEIQAIIHAEQSRASAAGSP